VKRYPKWWISTLAACCLLGVATAQGSHPIELAQDSQQGETASQPLEFVPKRVIVKFRPELAPVAVQMITDALLTEVEGSIPELGVLFLKVPDDADEQDYEALFQSLPAVEYAELDYIVPPATSYSRTVIPNDPWFDPGRGYGWHLTRVGAHAAWYYQRGSPQIVIAVLDTGVNPVSDLAGKLVPGWNIYLSNNDTRDIGSHGTEVSCVAAAVTNNGIGVAGLAWNCRVMPVRIAAMGGTATYSHMAEGLIWAANHGARVANLSYRIDTANSLLTDAARYFMERTRGVVVVAAGNDGSFSNNPDNPYLIRVSGLDVTNLRLSNSNYGTDVDLCAPMYNIYTMASDGRVVSGTGTSFSAPLVAATAALVLSANPSLSGEQVEQILKRSAVDLGPLGWDSEYGWGCVNAARAVLMARGLLPESTPPTIRITNLSDGAVVRGAIWISCEVVDLHGISHLELYVDGARTAITTRPYPSTGSNIYRLYWDSRRVSNGWYTLTIVAQDGMGNRGDVSIRVYVNNS